MDYFVNTLNFIFSSHLVFYSFLFFYFGAIVGSFLNLVIDRTPKILNYNNAVGISEWFNSLLIPIPEKISTLASNKISLSFPRSHCFNCNTPLKWHQNIPLISFILLKGKCSKCSSKIGFSSFFVELLFSFLFLFSFLYFHLNVIYLFSFILFISLGTLISINDFKSYTILTDFCWILILSSIFLSYFNLIFSNISFVDCIFGIIVGYFILYLLNFIGELLLSKTVVGDGDFIFLASLGGFFGIEGVFVIFLLSSFVGVIFWILFYKLLSKDIIPYALVLFLSSILYFFNSNLLN